MRTDFTDEAISENAQKNRAFNILRNNFSREILRRFHGIKSSIEDIWDLVTNKAVLSGRLQTIAARDPSTWTINNLMDMALICCILWNDTEDIPPEPEE
jgi:hypothetical protein